MASPNFYPNGAGGSSGDDYATCSPVLQSGQFLFVLSSSGSDSNSGFEREKPLATIGQALTNATAGDTIVMLSGHSESISSTTSIGKAGLMFVGEGTGNNRPRLTCNGAGIDMLNVGADGVKFRNVYFPASTQAGTRIRVANPGTEIIDCYFECGAIDSGYATYLGTGANHCRISGTTYISTSTGARPVGAVIVNNAITDLTMEDVVISGGTVGWDQPHAFVGSAAVTRIRARDVDLLLGSDVLLATGTTGSFHVRNRTGSGRVVWTA